MRLWTMQPPEVLEIIEKTGKFTCDKEKSYWHDDEYFCRAYDYMIAQMHINNIRQPKNTTWPIWAWHTWNWKHKKPDLRNIGLGKRGRKCVCIELEIPDNKVLLSDELQWHCVLNNDYNNPGKTEEKWDYYNDIYESLKFPFQKEIIKIASWNNIFDVTPCDNGFVANGKYIQAVFWEIKKENIIRTQEFIGK